MHSINTVSHSTARRLRLWRYSSRPCFLPSKHWPVLSSNASLTRRLHDGAHSQAPPLLSRLRQLLRFGKKSQVPPQSPPQYTKLDPDDSLAGRASEVPHDSYQTLTADARDVAEPSLPFVCVECGSKFRNQQGLHGHYVTNKAQQIHLGEAGGCKNRISVAGMKVNPHVSKLQYPRDLKLTVGIGEKIFEKSSRELKPSKVAVSQDSGYEVVSTFNAKSETTSTTSSVSVPGSPPFWKGQKLPVYLPQRVFKKDQSRKQSLQPFNLLLLSVKLMSSEPRYDRADIVTNITVLRKLLRFCKGQPVGNCRFLLRMIRGSLFLANDSNPMSAINRTEDGDSRSDLVSRYTQMPSGLEHSSHFRSVQYSLGHLNCMVQNKASAVCSILPGEIQQPASLSSAGPVTTKEYHPQVKVAMIQVRRDGSKWMKGPQIESFWFSRTPFLLRACLSNDGNLTKVSKLAAFVAAREWEKEEKQQLALRKLSKLLSDLKRAVEAAAPKGQACIGLIDRHTDPPTIQVFLPERK